MARGAGGREWFLFFPFYFAFSKYSTVSTHSFYCFKKCDFWNNKTQLYDLTSKFSIHTKWTKKYSQYNYCIKPCFLYNELVRRMWTERQTGCGQRDSEERSWREIPKNVTVVHSSHWHNTWFVFSFLYFNNLGNLMNVYFFLVRRKLGLLKDHGDGYLSIKITRRGQRSNARNIKKVNFFLLWNVLELYSEEGRFCDNSRSWLNGWHSWWWNQQRGRSISKRDKWEL